jgi:hypothetical protein
VGSARPDRGRRRASTAMRSRRRKVARCGPPEKLLGLWLAWGRGSGRGATAPVLEARRSPTTTLGAGVEPSGFTR